MKLKKVVSYTKPSTRTIKNKIGITRTIQVKSHVNKLSLKPKRK